MIEFVLMCRLKNKIIGLYYLMIYQKVQFHDISTLFYSTHCRKPVRIQIIGQKTFPLKKGKGVGAIQAIGSMKLLEAQSIFVIKGCGTVFNPFCCGYK